MTPKSRPKVALSQVAFGDLKNLQGNLRRQMIIAIDELEEDLRPSNSKQLIMKMRLEKFAVYDSVNGELFMQ